MCLFAPQTFELQKYIIIVGTILLISQRIPRSSSRGRQFRTSLTRHTSQRSGNQPGDKRRVEMTRRIWRRWPAPSSRWSRAWPGQGTWVGHGGTHAHGGVQPPHACGGAQLPPHTYGGAQPHTYGGAQPSSLPHTKKAEECCRHHRRLLKEERYCYRLPKFPCKIDE